MNTEKIVKNNLSDLKDSSILIVSQRISTIKDADEILVMKNGEIIDRGTHNQLVESCNLYKEIVKNQQGQLGD
jgi:ATP-binding cassette subfamily B protein